MRPRGFFAAGIALLVLGLGVLLFAYPLSPGSDPAPVEVSFPGSYAEAGVIRVTEAGTYAIWESGTTGGDRCRVSTRSGSELSVEEPALTVRWHPEGSDAIDTYTLVGTFEARSADTYGIKCTIDDAPGTAFAVTEKPGTGLSVVALIGGVVLALAGIAAVALAFLRRRSRLHEVQ